MKKQIKGMKNATAGLMTGLASLVYGCGVQLSPESTPAEDIFRGARVVKYEKDIQQGFNDSHELKVNEDYKGDVTFNVSEIPEENKREFPFRVYALDNLMIFEDKPEEVPTIDDGAEWRIKVEARPEFGFSDFETFVVAYHRGHSPEYLETHQINDIEERLGEVEETLEEHISGESEPPQHYVIGDGRCDASLGEPADSPDCENTIPPYVIGDNVCSPGEPLTSPDCAPEPRYIIGDGKCDRELGEPETSPDCIMPPQPSELERLIDFACDLQRGIDFNGLDTRIYKVTPQGENNFVVEENLELPIGHPEYAVANHILPEGPTNGYWVVVAGNNVGEISRMYAGIAEAEQFAPENCNDILVLNSRKEPLANQSFGVVVDRENAPDIYEQIRVKVGE